MTAELRDLLYRRGAGGGVCAGGRQGMHRLQRTLQAWQTWLVVLGGEPHLARAPADDEP